MEIELPDFNKEDNAEQPQLKVDTLTYHSGNKEITPEKFVETVSPFFDSLSRVKRTNYLCLFVYGNGDKPDVTGYNSPDTMNVTNNSRILKTKETNGSWVIYSLMS